MSKFRSPFKIFQFALLKLLLRHPSRIIHAGPTHHRIMSTAFCEYREIINRFYANCIH